MRPGEPNRAESSATALGRNTTLEDAADDDGADIWAALGEAHMEFQQDVPVGTTASTFQLPTGIGGGSIW